MSSVSLFGTSNDVINAIINIEKSKQNIIVSGLWRSMWFDYKNCRFRVLLASLSAAFCRKYIFGHSLPKGLSGVPFPNCSYLYYINIILASK